MDSNMKKKVFIATPAYSGTVNVPYALSLAETMFALKTHGIDVVPRITASGSLLVAERNRLLEAFWQSDCTHMLCIDGDLGWPAQAVLAMLDADKEFVAGVYPARGDANAFLFRPEKQANGAIVQDKHLLKMQYIPAGFMLISRSAVKKMREKHPDLYFEPKAKDCGNPSAGYCLFNTEVYEGEFWGEDFVFCRKAREAGVDIWVDPLIQFDHAGTLGMLIQALTTNPEESRDAKSKPIQAGS
jgi:hypothetical protein